MTTEKSHDPTILRQEGNDFFNSHNYDAAIASYTSALQLDPSDSLTLSNRSQAYLKVGRFRLALVDADTALRLDPNNAKALFRRARALYAFRRWHEAADSLNRAKKIANPEKDLIDLSERIQKRLTEVTAGKYDLISMIKEANLRGRRLERANFVSRVEVMEIIGKGRGLIAMEDIEEGGLILAEKALEIVFSEEIDGGIDVEDEDYSEIKEASITTLVERILKHMEEEPEVTKKLLNLHNSFHSSQEDSQEDYLIINGEKINPDLIENICGENGFSPDEHFLSDPFLDSPISPPRHYPNGARGCGIWLLSSYINHSCISNACRIFIGDMMLIRALTPIVKGEEITLPYVSSLEDLDGRRERFSKRGFVCDCGLCTEQAEISSSEGQKLRRKLVEEVQDAGRDIIKGKPSMIPKLKDIIAQIRESYDTEPSVEFPLQLYLPYTALSVIYRQKKQFKEAALAKAAGFKCLPRRGDFCYGRMQEAMVIAVDWHQEGNKDKRDKWLAVSKKECKIVFGGEEEFWRRLWARQLVAFEE